MAINGNGVGTPMPRTNWNQTDPTKADYLKGRDELLRIIQNAQTSADAVKTVADDAKTVADDAKTSVNNHKDNKSNPHGVSCDQIGARPNTWVPTASDVGAAPDGYGLGTTTPTSITTTEQLDATRNCGFYRYYISGSTICGITFTYGSLIVYPIGAGGSVQELRPYGTNYCLRRYYQGSTWSAWVDCSPSAFAPSGFGLGLTTPTSITTAEELHNTRKCGFYRYNISGSNICGISFSNASLIVYSITTNGCVQELRPFKSNYCLRRYYSGTTWTEWELVGGVQELVWENANRTSAVGSPQLVMEMPVYDEYLAYCCLNAGEQNSWIIAARCPVGETLTFNFVWADDGIKYHRAIETSQEGFSFGEGYRQGVVDGKACIPLKIYGIKGVSK